MRKFTILLISSFILTLTSSAFALPDLQVYITGSSAMDYGSDQETWFVPYTPGNFQLNVVGSYGPNDTSITDAILLVTVPQGQSGTISGLGAGTFHTDLSFLPGTTPELNHYPLNSPALYDFYTFSIGDFANNSPVTLPDYNASTGNITYQANAEGEIKQFNVSVSGYSYLHLDAYANFAYTHGPNAGEGWRANPGSHDSGLDPDIPGVPEPSSLLLLGLGLGLGLRGRFGRWVRGRAKKT